MLFGLLLLVLTLELGKPGLLREAGLLLGEGLQKVEADVRLGLELSPRSMGLYCREWLKHSSFRAQEIRNPAMLSNI